MTFDDLPQVDGLTLCDISREEWREYDFDGRVYRIHSPIGLYLRMNPCGSTHRVVDCVGVVHCVPAIGMRGCILRWRSLDHNHPVNF
jgi:hypothetical protein